MTRRIFARGPSILAAWLILAAAFFAVPQTAAAGEHGHRDRHDGYVVGKTVGALAGYLYGHLHKPDHDRADYYKYRKYKSKKDYYYHKKHGYSRYKTFDYRYKHGAHKYRYKYGGRHGYGKPYGYGRDHGRRHGHRHHH